MHCYSRRQGCIMLKAVVLQASDPGEGACSVQHELLCQLGVSWLLVCWLLLRSAACRVPCRAEGEGGEALAV